MLVHCLLLAAAAVAAAAASAPLPPLALEEAIDIALRYNETPRIAAARVDRARAVRAQAVAELLPTLFASGTGTRRATEVTRQFEGEAITIQARNAFSSSVLLDAPLFDASAIAGVKSAEKDVAAQIYYSDDLNRQLAFAVADSFFAVLSAEKLAEAAERRLSVATATVEEARSRFEAGLAARNEVTRVELEQASAELALTESRNLVARTRIQLEYLLGTPVERDLLTPPETEAGARDAEELEALAAARRPDLLGLRAQAEGTRLAVRQETLGFVPDLDFRGTWRVTNEAGLSGNDSDWNLAATLGWSIFDRARAARAATFDALYREEMLQSEALTRQIRKEIREALQELDTARAGYAQAEVRVRVAEQNESEVKERFANGLATALEQADATASLFEAEAELARQGFARWVAEQTLENAIGNWPLGRGNWEE